MKCYRNINITSKSLLFLVHAKILTIKADKLTITHMIFFYNIFRKNGFNGDRHS